MATVEERLMKVEEGFIKVVDLLEKHSELIKRNSELLAEVRRDAQKTQRLWVRLAQRHGWIEDEDWEN